MKEVTSYLLEKRVLENDTLYWITKHRKWCKSYGTTPETIKFNEVIVYVEDLTLQYQNQITVNMILRQVKWYYEYLLEHQKIKRNLFDHKYLAKEKRRIYAHITSLMSVPNRFDK